MHRDCLFPLPLSTPLLHFLDNNGTFLDDDLCLALILKNVLCCSLNRNDFDGSKTLPHYLCPTASYVTPMIYPSHEE